MNRRVISVLAMTTVLASFIALPAGDAAAKKKKKKPPACAAYTPGEQGTDKPTVVVTDLHTAETPLEQPITLAESLSEGIVDEASYDYFNLQVDSAAASAGLYVTFEFAERRDYDLFARWPDGSEAASSHGFQPLIEAKTGSPDVSNTSTNHAGESTSHSENLIGVITPDCGGYTIEAANWLGEGGDFAIKVWLGEGANEPLPPGS